MLDDRVVGWLGWSGAWLGICTQVYDTTPTAQKKTKKHANSRHYSEVFTFEAHRMATKLLGKNSLLSLYLTTFLVSL